MLPLGELEMQEHLERAKQVHWWSAEPHRAFKGNDTPKASTREAPITAEWVLQAYWKPIVPYNNNNNKNNIVAL